MNRLLLIIAAFGMTVSMSNAQNGANSCYDVINGVGVYHSCYEVLNGLNGSKLTTGAAALHTPAPGLLLLYANVDNTWHQLTSAGVDTSLIGSGGGSVAWGAITGTLSAQTDLQNALNGKLDLHATSDHTLAFAGVPAQCASGSAPRGIDVSGNAFGCAVIGGGGAATAIVSGLLSALPATCTVGAVYFATDQPAGQQIYACSAVNVWTQEVNLGGSGALAFTSGSLDINTAVVPRLAAANPFAGLNNFAVGIDMTEQSSGSTPVSGKLHTYANTDHRIHQVNSSGVDTSSVSSVGLLAPVNLFTVTNSPITNNGTLILAYQTGQTPNLVLGTDSFGNVGLFLLTGAQLPNPSSSSLGGIQSAAAVTNQWIDSISTSGVPHLSRPAAADVSGLAASATTDTTNATNISSGTLAAARVATLNQNTTGSAVSLAPSIYTVSTLPASPVTNQIARISDGTTIGDCTTGSGAIAHSCQWNGSAWVFYSTKSIVLVGGSGVVASLQTVFASYGTSSTNATEGLRQEAMPLACRASNFQATIITAQSALGSLVLTMRKNASSVAPTVTFALSAPALTISSDNTNTADFLTSDLFTVQIVNNAAATSATISSFTFVCSF